MKKLTTILFILISIVIAFFIIKETLGTADKKTNTFVSIDLTSNEDTSNNLQNNSIVADNGGIDVLVPLFPDEIVVTNISLDFNDDYYTDQIVAVKDSADPVIKILVCLFNPNFGSFERTYKIVTDIQQTDSFSLDVLDITGTHTNSIIASGLTENNESLLYAWLEQTNFSSVSFKQIAAIKADGTTLVHQIARNSSYAFSQEPGESFPIWAYTSVPGAAENSLDQIHIVYDWNPDTQEYEKQSEKLIYGKNINAQDLAKIFDGTEKTFGTFLNSTWVKTNANNETVSIYFDYPQKTITFLNNDTAEIYNWESSIMRTNGMLIYTENVNVPTLLRRVGVTLVSANEIRIIATDSLTMVSAQNTLWDGTYKKQGIESSLHSKNNISSKKEQLLEYVKEIVLDKNWKSDFEHTIQFNDTTFSTQSGKEIKESAYTIFNEYNEIIMQCKNKDGFLNGFYSIKIIEPTEDLGMQLELTPVSIGATQLSSSINPKIILEEVILESETLAVSDF